MRLIDADKLLAEYDAQHQGPPGRARALVENAPTVNGWISVEDRLPEPPAECFVYSRRMRGMGIATYTEWGWMTPTYFPEITHWMPLPEPPKEVSEDD